jgi:hypothetical protein
MSNEKAALRSDLLVPLGLAYQHVRMVIERDYTPEERQRVGVIALNAISEVRLALYAYYEEQTRVG